MHLSALIRRVTEDLQAIQAELNSAARPNTSSAERDRIMQQLIDANMVNEFKTAVDHMRHLLWSYIEASHSGQTDVAHSMQVVRMQRVTEMLRILAPDVHEAAASQMPEARSFFELINEIANTEMDRHSRGPQ